MRLQEFRQKSDITVGKGITRFIEGHPNFAQGPEGDICPFTEVIQRPKSDTLQMRDGTFFCC
jgi:hypothetical protein